MKHISFYGYISNKVLQRNGLTELLESIIRELIYLNYKIMPDTIGVDMVISKKVVMSWTIYTNEQLLTIDISDIVNDMLLEITNALR